MLNGHTFTTVADENGAYSLDVLTTNIEQLLLIESWAINAETGDSIEFVNLVGAFSRGLGEEEPINVTNVTTAKYSLLLEANGGQVPANLQELKQAETAVDATALFQLAAVIKLIVDDPNYQLPAGYNSLLCSHRQGGRDRGGSGLRTMAVICLSAFLFLCAFISRLLVACLLVKC